MQVDSFIRPCSRQRRSAAEISFDCMEKVLRCGLRCSSPSPPTRSNQTVPQKSVIDTRSDCLAGTVELMGSRRATPTSRGKVVDPSRLEANLHTKGSTEYNCYARM